jgi:hypothetical protein
MSYQIYFGDFRQFQVFTDVPVGELVLVNASVREYGTSSVGFA